MKEVEPKEREPKKSNNTLVVPDVDDEIDRQRLERLVEENFALDDYEDLGSYVERNSEL